MHSTRVVGHSSIIIIIIKVIIVLSAFSSRKFHLFNIMSSDMQFHDEFLKFCTTEARTKTTDDEIIWRQHPGDVLEAMGYENPLVWHKRYKETIDREWAKDTLFDTMEMKYIVLRQYGRDQPEFIKWKLFGYNIVICFEYILRKQLNKAYEIIYDIEDLLDSIGNNDIFLKSIKSALNHVAFSMKAHLLKLCKRQTEMERFTMPNVMNQINRAGLFGIQALFFYEYDTLSTQLSKESALKAIKLNDAEPEWYFLLARILCNQAKFDRYQYYVNCEEELLASKAAVDIGNKDQHKLHLSSVYLRMSKNKKIDSCTKNQYLDTGIKLLNELTDNTNDLILLKFGLASLSKVYSPYTTEITEKLVNKLEKSDNGYVHGTIGNYYLYTKQNYQKALFHLKKGRDAKSFGCSIDYIYTLYRMNPSEPAVETMLAQMLETFPHPMHQEKILSQMISYLLVTVDDVNRALKYIPMLLSLKNICCVFSLRCHKMKFNSQFIVFDLLNTISEKLNSAKIQTLSVDMKKVADCLEMLESYERYVSDVTNKQYAYKNHFKTNGKTNVILNNNNEQKSKWLKNTKQDIITIVKNKDEQIFKKDFNAKNYTPLLNNNYGQKGLWIKNNKQDVTAVKSKDEGNWRTLKPDNVPNTHIFARGNQKPINNDMEDSQKNKFY